VRRLAAERFDRPSIASAWRIAVARVAAVNESDRVAVRVSLRIRPAVETSLEVEMG
jgi:hypothetical protein